MNYPITQNDYFQRRQPAKSEELLNIIEVQSNPLRIQDFEDEFFKTSQGIWIAAGDTVTQECKYKSVPLLTPTATAYWVPETATTEDPAANDDLLYNDTTGNISSPVLTSTAEYYAWGANVTVTNNYGTDGFCIIVISGYPLKVVGDELVVAQDNASIAENGELKYTYKNNHLIQRRDVAQEIADTLLATYVTPRKDTTVEWRGNPAIELRDTVEVPEYQKDGIDTRGIFTIYKQTLTYDGTLRQSTEARKVAETTTTTTAGP